MTRGMPWSEAEVAATVADYLSMLAAELRGEPYSKTEHRNRLSPLLAGRSDGSIERKRQNISAVLLEMGLPYVEGYKPLANYQGILREAVLSALPSDKALTSLMENAADQVPDALPQFPSPKGLFVPPPRTAPDQRPARHDGSVSPRLPVDYEERERRNRRLGSLGEEFVIEVERRRLAEARRPDLAARVEWVARTRGDGLGYDVASWEEDASGGAFETCIEVKTTNQGVAYPFFLTAAELEASERLNGRYRLYRVFRFSRDPRLFVLSGSLRRRERLGELELRPRLYEVRL